MAQHVTQLLRDKITSAKMEKALQNVQTDHALKVDGFHLEIIKEGRYEEMMAFCRRYYIPDEPIWNALNHKWDRTTEELILKSLSQNLTIAYVSNSTGEIVGAQVITIDNRYEQLDLEKYSNGPNAIRMDIVITRLNKLNNFYDFYGTDEVVHLWQLSVKTEERCQGIGTKVIKTVIECIKNINIGPVVIRVEGSSNYSKKIFDKLGFNYLAEVSLIDYEVNDEKLNTGEHKSLILYGKIHTGQCKSTGGCYNELVVAYFGTGGGVKWRKR